MKARGFTLLEVLVALLVAAVALSAAGKAVSTAIDGVAAGRDHTLALWVAENRLADLQSQGTLPDSGTRSGEAEEAGLRLVWRQEISATPNSRFRVARISVAGADRPDYELARLSGYLVRK